MLVLIKQICGYFHVRFEQRNEHEKNASPVDNKYSEETIFLNYYPTEKTSFLLQGLNPRRTVPGAVLDAKRMHEALTGQSFDVVLHTGCLIPTVELFHVGLTECRLL